MLTGMVRIPAVTPPDISPMRLGRPIRVPAATVSVGIRAGIIVETGPGWPRQEVRGAGAPGGSRLAPRHVPGLRLPPLEAPRWHADPSRGSGELVLSHLCPRHAARDLHRDPRPEARQAGPPGEAG